MLGYLRCLLVTIALLSSSAMAMISSIDVNQTISSDDHTESIDTAGLGQIAFTVDVTNLTVGATVIVELKESDDNILFDSIVQTSTFTVDGSDRVSSNLLTGKCYRFYWTITGTTPSADLKVTSSLREQAAVSGSISVPGVSTTAKQDIGNASLASIDTKLTSPLSVAQSGSWTVNALQSGSWTAAVTQSGTWTVQQGGAPWTLTGTGTAGSAAAGVVTVQGIASMTPLLVNGSGFTQPISGTVTSNQGGSWTVDAVQSGAWTTAVTQGTSPWLTSRDWSLSDSTDAITVFPGATFGVNITAIEAEGSPPPLQAMYVAGQDPFNELHGLRLNSVYHLLVDNSSHTQPISAVALPLPSGAATAAKQDTGNASLASVDTKLSTTNSTLSTIDGHVDGLETLATAGNASLASIDGDVDVALSTRASESTLSTLNGKVANNYGAASGAVRVASQVGNASGVADFGAGAVSAQTQRVIVATDQSALPVTQSTSPWVTSATQSGTWSLRLQDGSGNAITSQVNGSQRALDVGINVAGVQVDPRTRSWTLASGTDSVASVQSGAWTTGRTWTLASGTDSVAAVQSGSWTTGRTWALSSSTDSVQPVLIDVAPATQTITAQDSGTASLVGANGQVFYFGTPTVGSAATFALASIQGGVIEASLLGAGGTMVIETSGDNGLFWMRPSIFQPGTQNYTNSFTSNFGARINLAGMTHVRVRSASAWTGTATITVKESLNISSLVISDALPPGGNVIGGVTQSGGPWTSNVTQFGGAAIATGTGAGGAGIPRVTVSSDSSITNISGTISLPTGASTSANQTSEITALQILDDVPAAMNGAFVKGAPSMGQLDDTSTTAATEDNVAPVRITAARGEHVNLRNNAGTELGTTANPVVVTQNSNPYNSRQTYSYAVDDLAVAALATDVFTITGSGTKTVRITRLEISCSSSTGIAVDFDLIKRSAANTGGTSSTITAAPHDSANGAATATIRAYTVNPAAVGAPVATVRSDRTVVFSGVTQPTQVVTWDFGSLRNAQEVTLRGTSEVLSINLDGATIVGGVCDIDAELVEE